MEVAILFYIFAITAIVSVFFLITRKSVFSSALCFEICLLAIVGLSALLGARTFSSILAVVMAGAVFALLIFVISITEKKKIRERKIRFSAMIASVACIYLFFILGLSVLKPPYLKIPQSGEMYESPLRIGEVLFAKFLIPFEFLGLMFILIAVSACLFSIKQGDRNV